MLILVAVTINVLINSNIFGSAKNGTKRYQSESDRESQIDELITIENETLSDYLANIQNNNGGDIQAGQRAENGNKSYKGVTIPEGFTVSGIPDESNSIAEGIVIYDIPSGVDTSTENFWTATTEVGAEASVPTVQTLYNQYVWVPVETAYVTAAEIENIISEQEFTGDENYTANQKAINYLISQGKYPMAVQVDNGIDYRGILYDFGDGEGTPVTITSFADFSTSSSTDYTAPFYFREPAYLTSYDSNSSYNTVGITQEILQNEYNNIVKSVSKYGGFFVARYELTREGTSPNLTFGSIRGKKVAANNPSSVSRWYGFYSACQTLGNDHSGKATSTMISGSQWDQIMIWMKDVKNIQNESNYYIIDSRSMGNYSGSSQVSGYSNSYSVKKIFDLAGNLLDWTTEAQASTVRTSRGNEFAGSNDSYRVYSRYYSSPSETWVNDSARATLYINTNS